MTETWAYQAANTIEITGDLTAKYWPNQLIKIAQGTEKFFVIMAVSLVGGNTRLTVSGGGVYTLTSDAVTAHHMTTNAAPVGLPSGFAAQADSYAAVSKDTPVDADRISLWDSVASFGRTNLTWANLKATLKAYFDTLYAAAAKGVTNGDSHDHVGGDGAQIDHGGLGGLSDDDHAGYALLAGRSGGQTLIGGTGSGESLTMQSTSHATKGSINIDSTIVQSDSFVLKRYSRLLIPNYDIIANGTYGGYLLLARAYTSGRVENSEVVGTFLFSRGGTSTGSKNDFITVTSKTAYQTEIFFVDNRTCNGFVISLVKITYGGVVYHAIKLASVGGFPNNGIFFDGYATDNALPTIIRSDVGSNETAYGYTGIIEDYTGNITVPSIYVTGNCSALSFTDRTEAFIGNALAAIKKIAADENGNIDHASLPEFAIESYRDEDGEWWPGRNIGNMISVLTVGMQQMIEQMVKKDAQIADLTARLEKLEKKVEG